jgi:predicted Zn-dependent protease
MVSTTYVEEMDQKSDIFCHTCQEELAELTA